MSSQNPAPDRDLQHRLAIGERALLEAMVHEPHVFSPKNALALDEAPNPKLYRISSGAAVCRRIFGDGRSQITSILIAGDLLGAQALIAAPSFDVIEVLEPMSVQSISR